MSVPSPDALRRGWCPGTLRPMETGDGWLVRLHPPGGELSPRQLAFVGDLAREHGNGQIEISSRGNLQLRGVSAETHPPLVEALLGAGLVDEAEGAGPSRLVLASPLAGLARGEMPGTAALAERVERAGREVEGLPAKFSIVVDGGGAPGLDEFACDLRLRAFGDEAVTFGFPDGSWFGPVAPEAAAGIAKAILAGFAAIHSAEPQRVRRMRDLDAAETTRLAAVCGLGPRQAPQARQSAAPIGIVPLADGRYAVLTALPFGRTTGDGLARIAALAAEHGSGEIRLSPWRGLAFPGLDEGAADGLAGKLAREGLILGSGDPRLSVSACPGAPACMRGETASMADAAILAQAMAGLLAKGVDLHVSGCVKGCAHPGPAALTLVGHGGLYDVVLAGGTRDPAMARLTLPELVRRLEPGQDIAARLVGASS